jgi:CP family cyanate transporter-like MFS transporter
MSSARPLPLWAGRGLALAGILLVALNLRTAVASISPITSQISVDIPLSGVALGFLGALPPIAFALSGLFAPLLARRFGLEVSITLAAAAMLVGHVARGLSTSYSGLLGGSVLALAGMGFGNILLPPAVKRYFPDRIGLVTTAYATLLAISTAVPAVLAGPVADAAGWRASLGEWSVLAATAMIPWALLVARGRLRGTAGSRAAGNDHGTPDDAVEAPEGRLFLRMLRSRVAWAIGLSFAVSSLNAYAAFAWYPSMLTDIAGVDHITAGALVAVFGLMGLPAALVVPVLAARMRNVGLLVQAGVVFFIVGYLGLLLAPASAPLLWVVLTGLGPLIFPVCLVLINLRTRSHHTSTALSGVVQTIGYTIGAFGPLVVGVLHDDTRGWTVPLVFLLCTTAIAAVSGVMLARPHFVEDDLERVSSGRGTGRGTTAGPAAP